MYVQLQNQAMWYSLGKIKLFLLGIGTYTYTYVEARVLSTYNTIYICVLPKNRNNTHFRFLCIHKFYIHIYKTFLKTTK